MGLAAKKHARPQPVMNVTPLVDVVLVLLIIFMVVTPLLTRGREVALPAARTGTESASGADALVLTITAGDGLWLDHARSSPAALPAQLRARDAASRPLVLKVDGSLSMRALRPVLTLVRDAGVRDVSLLVRAPAGGAP